MRRVEIGRRECEPDRALAAFIELRGDPLPEGPIAARRDQLEVGVVQPEQRIRCALAGMISAPRRAAGQQRGVAPRGVVEVAHGEDDVVERVEHMPSMPDRPECSIRRVGPAG
ncbi:hypothetical protein MULP_01670 [Mycobacterium liflandii 128FXT]|uniref:Uncharacterized protein n=1 Tax=Mycobacterium liflandii (strain 128FXT) TaxID=459424 RepID=L7V870_MYCL1|nr:hypothetical protein MULP_01670 [Mycobacterium liflandii 128FXT]RFZ71261.1 hypothetical protein BB170200_00340 [Mycobacterium marinum]